MRRRSPLHTQREPHIRHQRKKKIFSFLGTGGRENPDRQLCGYGGRRWRFRETHQHTNTLTARRGCGGRAAGTGVGDVQPHAREGHQRRPALSLHYTLLKNVVGKMGDKGRKAAGHSPNKAQTKYSKLFTRSTEPRHKAKVTFLYKAAPGDGRVALPHAPRPAPHRNSSVPSRPPRLDPLEALVERKHAVFIKFSIMEIFTSPSFPTGRV